MAVFCLARDLDDLQDAARQDRSSAQTRDGKPVHGARPQGATARWRCCCKDALAPNLVQTLEGIAGVRAWRPVRQYRAWLQLGDGDATRA